MFVLSKLLAFLTQPLAWVLVLMLVAMLTLRRWPVVGRRLVGCACGLLLAIGWQLPSDALLRSLENKYPARAVSEDFSNYAGVVVLGGALEPPYVWQGHPQPAMNSAAERMTTTITLIQQQPRLKVIFTGGESDLIVSGRTEAQRAMIFFRSMGIDDERIVYEGRARNTHENAVLSAQLPGVDITRRWLLLTSASHMPRAMATFEAAGWNVTAYPCDFRTGLQTPWYRYDLADSAQTWRTALHELLGLLAYRLMGRL